MITNIHAKITHESKKLFTIIEFYTFIFITISNPCWGVCLCVGTNITHTLLHIFTFNLKYRELDTINAKFCCSTILD